MYRFTLFRQRARRQMASFAVWPRFNDPENIHLYGSNHKPRLLFSLSYVNVPFFTYIIDLRSRCNILKMHNPYFSSICFSACTTSKPFTVQTRIRHFKAPTAPFPNNGSLTWTLHHFVRNESLLNGSLHPRQSVTGVCSDSTDLVRASFPQRRKFP